MTSTPYPNPNPAPGSNAIGDFIIGVSQIGTIPSFNFWSTILNQYASSDIITSLISNMSEYIDMTANIDAFYDNMFNVATAIGYGLDCCGRIVGVTRNLQIPGAGTYFGFAQQSPTVDDFGPGGASPFFTGEALTTSYSLTDPAFRTLVFAKALANITDGSIPSLNSLLLSLFPGRGNCYVVDGENMTMEYVFAFALTPVEVAIVTQSGVLPKPVGVAATYVQLVP